MVSVAWIGLGESPTTETGPYDPLGSVRTFVVHDDLLPHARDTAAAWERAWKCRAVWGWNDHSHLVDLNICKTD